MDIHIVFMARSYISLHFGQTTSWRKVVQNYLVHMCNPNIQNHRCHYKLSICGLLGKIVIICLMNFITEHNQNSHATFLFEIVLFSSFYLIILFHQHYPILKQHNVETDFSWCPNIHITYKGNFIFISKTCHVIWKVLLMHY